MKYTIVIPAKNEAQGLKEILPKLQNLGAQEIIVVDDGSTDDTKVLSESFGCRVISHPYSMGNGAAVKSGAREVTTDTILFMDADGQHDPDNIPDLLAQYNNGYDMMVGARTSQDSQAGMARGFGNKLYNWFASWMVGHKIEDLTSGFRVVNRKKFLQFLYMLPNGFSYPTTSTMAFFRVGYKVGYLPVTMPPRVGKSHLRIFRDGIKFLLIIFKIGTLYSPLKIFLPIALLQFVLGMGRYAYTLATSGTFTNMSALLLSSAVTVFLIGLVSEQISNLNYKN
ncbi:MAG: glycosyltransferase involved in cell wall biosynthesis, partial [Arenicella sp.]|jgi:glycosyltransferase involved in cell wall biosynthesis